MADFQLWMSQSLDKDSEDSVVFLFFHWMRLQSGWALCWKGVSDSAKSVCLSPLSCSICFVFIAIAAHYLRKSFAKALKPGEIAVLLADMKEIRIPFFQLVFSPSTGWMWRTGSVKRQAPHLVVKESGTEANREAAHVHRPRFPATVTWSHENKQIHFHVGWTEHNKGKNRNETREQVHSHWRLNKESFK